MKLTNEGIKNKEEWVSKNYRLPKYDRDSMIEKTKENPVWVHFGAGNIFRAFHANAAQKMLDEGFSDRGITVVEGFDYEIVEKMYRPHDDLSILVTLKADGDVEKVVVGGIAESCILDSENDTEYGRLKEIFSKDSLQLATFTITEKGYSLRDAKGNVSEQIKRDFENGPANPESYIGKVTSLLYTRYLSGKKKIAMVSTDNCSHNGDKLFAAVDAFAKEWVKNKKADEGFAAYVEDESYVSFPWTMIDKITPRPDPTVEKLLAEDSIEGLSNVVTAKNTYVAPFVNAEESEYLVIEDKFPNSRPELEKAGFIFTDRETVNKVEQMKVCTCLNPLHTALAVFGCLLGYSRISDEMKDEDLSVLVKKIGYDEGLVVVTDPGVIDPKDFIDTVINVRLPNPYMPDTPQRIATDTSQKLSIRFGETIKRYIEKGRNTDDLKLIPLVFAGWLRYLIGKDDELKEFEISPDPIYDTIAPLVRDIPFGDENAAGDAISDILHDERIFGVDLYEAHLADRVKEYFALLTKGKGAVRNTLHKYVV